MKNQHHLSHNFRFNLPFQPNPDYLKLLSSLSGQIHCIHYSLYDAGLADGRVRIDTLPTAQLCSMLQQIDGVRKYLLINGRFQHPDSYRHADRDTVDLAKQISLLHDAGQLDGLVFGDAYLLMAVAKALGPLARSLEAIPSINFCIDSLAVLRPIMALVASGGFLPPSRICLDRSCNRYPEMLRTLAAEIRAQYPETAIELLANEGCLSHCPFRASHEALIAAANCGIAFDTAQINRGLGCIHLFGEEPWKILSSPFIRPEDLYNYHDCVDVIKLCGRTLPGRTLQTIVSAYLAGSHTGNLFSLLDASGWMADHWQLDNKALDTLKINFHHQLSSCKSDCGSVAGCSFCKTIFARLAKVVPTRLADLR